MIWKILTVAAPICATLGQLFGAALSAKTSVDAVKNLQSNEASEPTPAQTGTAE